MNWAMHAQVDDQHISAKDAPGQWAYQTKGRGSVKVYRYMQMLDAVTYVAGHVCTFGDLDSDGTSGAPSGAVAGRDIPWTTATNDVDGSNRATWPFAGIAQRVFTQNYYGWLQFRGHTGAATVNGGIRVQCTSSAAIGEGDVLTVDTGNDGVANELDATQTSASNTSGQAGNIENGTIQLVGIAEVAESGAGDDAVDAMLLGIPVC